MTTLSVASATLERSASGRRTDEAAIDVTTLGRWAAVALQFGLLVGVIGAFDLENNELGNIAQLAWCGFLVHHFLPAKFRLPFFALLSIASLGVALPIRAAIGLLAMGAGLIALCHVPVSWNRRLVLVGAAATLLLAIRMEWLPAALMPVLPPRIWPILGSMFMFRLIAYLYDLRHSAAPFSVSRAIAYFFMLPNVALPLFPVVDYKTFCRSHFNDDRFHIYQVGLLWIFRGIIQLLLYQLVYLYLVVDPANAADAWDVVLYVVTTFLLYLRVSGTFHVIVGLLHMFGFNLPETHHLYYLSSSFTDFWRRINIYWKDFLTKVVFYPVYFRLKRFGEARAMIFATLVAFVTTWLLHSYQWLWLRGSFPLTWQDALFWLGLGTLVVINMTLERTQKTRRAIGERRLALRDRVFLGLRTAGTFAALSILWTIWNTPGTSLHLLASAARHVTVASIAAALAVLGIVGTAGVLLGQRKREDTESGRRRVDQTPARFWGNAAAMSLASLAMLASAKRPELLAFSPPLRDAAVSVRRDKLNRIDLSGRERGYYQNLGDVFRMNAQLGRLADVAPRDWNDNPAKRLRQDFLLWDYAPSTDVRHKNVAFTTNRLGMHDREYELVKAQRTFRIALAGASHEVGAGVPMLANYENLAEDRLNRERTNDRVDRYEILNLSIDGNPPLQKVAWIDERAYALHPDLVLYAAHGHEFEWIPRRLDELLQRGVRTPYQEIDRLLTNAGVEKGVAFDDVSRRLKPYRQDVMQWIFRHLRQTAADRGSRAAVLLLEKAEDPVRLQSLDQLAALAREEGLPVIDLWGAFNGIEPRESLYLAPWDSHPNARAHQLLADRLYQGLVQEVLLGEGQCSTSGPSVDGRSTERDAQGAEPTDSESLTIGGFLSPESALCGAEAGIARRSRGRTSASRRLLGE